MGNIHIVLKTKCTIADCPAVVKRIHTGSRRTAERVHSAGRGGGRTAVASGTLSPCGRMGVLLGQPPSPGLGLLSRRGGEVLLWVTADTLPWPLEGGAAQGPRSEGHTRVHSSEKSMRHSASLETVKSRKVFAEGRTGRPFSGAG